MIPSEYIHQLYPFNTNISRKLLIMGISAPLILILFQPFGMNYFQYQYKPLVQLGYGAITVIIEVLFYFLGNKISRFINKEKWKIYKELIWQLIILLAESVVMYFYSIYFTFFGTRFPGFSGFLLHFAFVIIVAIFPTIVVILVSQNRLQKQKLAIESEVDNQHVDNNVLKKDEQVISFVSDNDSQELVISASDIIYITVDGNYVLIAYKSNSGVINKKLRCTLKYCEQQIIDCSSLFKCHRAFIVNLFFIKDVSGNAQGYRVELEYAETSIPVSRNYLKEFNQKISRLKRIN